MRFGRVRMIPGKGFGSNSYVIEDDVLCVVDPGFTTKFGVNPAEVKVVVNTHAHADHVTNVFLFPNAVVYAHPAEGLKTARISAELRFGATSWLVLHTPGHTPGSICLYEPREKMLISGDTVFADGVGRTDLPGGSTAALKKSVEKLASLEVRVLLPGHGPPAGGRAIKEALSVFHGLQVF